MSNFVPLIVALPFPLLAFYFDRTGKTNLGMLFWALSPIALWMAINLFGLFQNERLRQSLLPFRPNAQKTWFVGFARPSYRGWLHPHEFVGWLALKDDSVEFYGENQTYRLNRNEITAIRKAWNIHTLLGLGGWICLEGRVSGQRVRMLVEPRERATMFGNFLLRKKIIRELQTHFRLQR